MQYSMKCDIKKNTKPAHIILCHRFLHLNKETCRHSLHQSVVPLVFLVSQYLSDNVWINNKSSKIIILNEIHLSSLHLFWCFRLLYARWWFTVASLSPGRESWWQSVGHVCCSRREVSYDPADTLSRFVLSLKPVRYPKSSSQSFWRNVSGLKIIRKHYQFGLIVDTFC